MHIHLDVHYRTAASAVKENRLANIKEKDTSIAGKFAQEHLISSGKSIRKAEIMLNLDPVGVNALLRLRTGTFKFTNEYVVHGSIPSTLRNCCMCCKETVKEDIWHFLMECQYFENERVNSIRIRQQGRTVTDPDKRKMLIALLGGEQVASDMKLSGTVLGVVKYLSIAAFRRRVLLTRLRSPPAVE